MITDWTEPTTIPRGPIVTGRNVTWSEDWLLDAALRPGRSMGRQQPQGGGETSTQTQVGVDDLPSATTSSSSSSASATSNTQQRSGSHVTGHGDPLERFYEIEESE